MNISRTALKLDTLRRSQKSGEYVIDKSKSKMKTKRRINPSLPNSNDIKSKTVKDFVKEECPFDKKISYRKLDIKV